MNTNNNNVFDDYYNSIFAGSNDCTDQGYDALIPYFDLVFADLLPKDKGTHLLDVGCGTGHFLYYLGKKGYTNLEGIDVSPGQIEICNTRTGGGAVIADAFTFLSGKSVLYDCISCNDIIEHIPKTKTIEFLRLMHTSLKPGGSLLIKCPNMGNPYAIYPRYKDFTHECGFTDRSLRQVLYLSGFRDISIYPSPHGDGTFINRLLAKAFDVFLRKTFWLQGFVAPEITSPLLLAKVRK